MRPFIMNSRQKRELVRIATEHASQFVSRIYPEDLPVDLHRIARKVGVVSISEAAMRESGSVSRDSSGYRIKLRRTDSWERKRFTLGHELGHVLLDQVSERGGNFVRSRSLARTDEERIANVIAAELLMPTSALVRSLRAYDRASGTARWTALHEMGRVFGVSLSAIALRLLDLVSINYVLFRVYLNSKLPSGARRHECKTSRNGELFFVRPPDAEAHRLWHEAQKRALHAIEMMSPTGRVVLRCEGRVRDIVARGVESKEYWVAGWAPAGLAPAPSRQRVIVWGTAPSWKRLGDD